MSTLPTAAVDAARVADIAQQIRNACTPVLGADEAKKDAQEVSNDAIAAATGARESIMVALAALSDAGSWTVAEIAAAAAKAASMSNNATEKALATFVGETKRAMHPNVRTHVPALIAVRDAAWGDETLARKVDKDAPTPIRKAFVRAYHCMMGLFSEAEAGNVILTCEGLTAHAEANDPDHDPKKVLKRLEGLKEQLAKFYADFPVDDIRVCVETLEDIGKNDLVRARARKLGQVIPTTVETTPTTVVNNTQPAPVPTAAVTSDKLARAFTVPSTTVETTGGHGPAAGAIDLLDDILAPVPHDNAPVALAALVAHFKGHN